MNEISLQAVVGKGYSEFWKCKKRYRVIKGSRASKKSKTCALEMIKRILKYPLSNGLCVRKTEKSLRDSCFAELKWAINRLGVPERFRCTVSPLEITYIPTGQKILFRGFDNPLKITSITVDVGYLCFCWVEEAFEIESESDFDTLDESIRGYVPDGYFKQITLTLNPWSETTWIKKKFFDVEREDTLAITRNYDCNEFLDEADIMMFERMKRDNPRRFWVAGLGNWGVAEGLVYENFEYGQCDLNKGVWWHCFGLDYGYTNDPTAFIAMAVNKDDRVIYIYDEFYEQGLLNIDIAQKIKEKGYQKEQIVADSAEPKSNDDLIRLGITRIKPSVKGKDSIINGIQAIQGYKIIVNTRCKNAFMELSTYCWDKDKQGKSVNRPIDSNNHLMDAMRYAFQNIKYKKEKAESKRKVNYGLTSADFSGGWY